MEAAVEAIVAWLITHPLPTVLGMVAVPIFVTLVNSARHRVVEGGETAEPEAPPTRVAAAAEAVEPEAVEPEAERVPVSPPARVPEPARAEPTPEEPAGEEPTLQRPVLRQPAPAPPKPARVPLRERLTRTSESLAGRIGGLLGGGKVDEKLLAELEALLFTADLGVRTAENLLQEVRAKAKGADASKVTRVLRDAILVRLQAVQPKPVEMDVDGPFVILVLGVNGSGKTTTIGKLAARHVAEGRKVILGAGDTFRAAAIDQLQVWGERVGCDVVAGPAGGDPSAVAFDTLKAAKARGMDVAIVDTAGRLQTKKPLMEELGKMARVLSREIPGAPHQSLLVLDANTGQNAISQAQLFSEVTQVTDLVLTKLDGTAKGGVIIGLADQFGIPVRYVGVGESADDLRDFDAEEFVDAIFPET
jgi:fused signal recognition particle receptor